MTKMQLSNDSDYIYEEVEITRVKELLEQGYDVEVSSPDGYTGVQCYIDKGPQKVFKIECNNNIVIASYRHLFETNKGWVLTENLDTKIHKILCDDGKYHTFVKTDIEEFQDVVDIGVENKQHRYYTNGLSSHNTNIGKTLIMCSMASAMLLAGKRVLYITFEDPEVKIGQRIMQNLMDKTQTELKSLGKDAYMRLFTKMLNQTGHNKLKIKEYPEYCVNALQIKALLKEYKEKHSFEPDVIMVDYLGCMIPDGRIDPNMNDNSRLRAITAQVRSIGMLLNIPIVSAMQSNRGGYGKAEIGLDDVADSYASTMKGDAIFGITQTPELKAAGMYTVKLLKTRYGMPKTPVATVGVDVEHQKIYDLKTFGGDDTPDVAPAETIPQVQPSQPVPASNTSDINFFEL